MAAAVVVVVVDDGDDNQIIAFLLGLINSLLATGDPPETTV